MKTQIEHEFPYSRESLLANYTSKDFLLKRFESENIDDYVISRFDDDDKHTKITIERFIEVKQDRLPGFITKLVGDSSKMITESRWDKARFEGKNSISTPKIPISAKFNFRLVEKSSGSCVNHVDVEINAKVPIVGKKIEKFLLPKAERGLKKDLDKMIAFLEVYQA